MRELERFVLFLLCFSLFVSVVLFFFIPALPNKLRFDEWWKIITFFFFTTIIFHYGLLKSTEKRPAAVTIYYLATTTIKLLLYIGIIIGYALLNREKAAGFVLTFFMLYFFYTVFEVGILYKKFSSLGNSKSEKKENSG